MKEAVTFGSSHFPFERRGEDAVRATAWTREEFPGTYDALARVLVLPWNEFYTEEHVQFIAESIHDVVRELEVH